MKLKAANPHTSRTIAFIDIENLTSSSTPTLPQCQRIWSIVEKVIDPSKTPVVAACSHRAAKIASFAIPGARWKWRSGPDGADLALLEELDPDALAPRFSHVVIASGDGIFAERAARLAAAGLTVTVVSRRRSLAKRLELASGHVVFIDDDTIAEVSEDVA